MTKPFEFVTDQVDDGSGGWSRTVRVDGQEYRCYIRRGKAVRIPYKPRGQNRGFKWEGSVWLVGGGRIWIDDVPKSQGCRGLLTFAGLI